MSSSICLPAAGHAGHGIVGSRRRARDDCFFAELVAAEFGGDAPSRMTSTRSASRITSGSSDETTITDGLRRRAPRSGDRSRPWRRHRCRASARRTAGCVSRRQPAADDRLLLVAAAEQADRPVEQERPQVDALASSSRSSPFQLALIDDATPARTRPARAAPCCW